MPLYLVRSLDVLGNPVDGYEVNDTRSLGELYVRPPFGPEDLGQQILEALEGTRWLDGLDGVSIEDNGDDDLEVTAAETAFVVLGDEPGPDGGTRFVSMAEGLPPLTAALTASGASLTDRRRYERSRQKAEDQLDLGEVLDVLDGHRPVLSLEGQFISDSGPRVFWASAKDTKRSENGTQYAVQSLVKFDPESQRIQVEVLADTVIDYFEWELAEWQRRPRLGFDPIDGLELVPGRGEVAAVLVALDGELEKGLY